MDYSGRRATHSEFPLGRPFGSQSGRSLRQVGRFRRRQAQNRFQDTAVMNLAVSAPISDALAPQGINFRISRCNLQFDARVATALSAQPFLWSRNAHLAETWAKLSLPKSFLEPPFFSAGCAPSDARQATMYITLAENSFSFDGDEQIVF